MSANTHLPDCAHLVTQNTETSHKEWPGDALAQRCLIRSLPEAQRSRPRRNLNSPHPDWPLLKAPDFLPQPQNQRVFPQAIWSVWICGLHWSPVSLEETPEAQITHELPGRVWSLEKHPTLLNLGTEWPAQNFFPPLPSPSTGTRLPVTFRAAKIIPIKYLHWFPFVLFSFLVLSFQTAGTCSLDSL